MTNEELNEIINNIKKLAQKASRQGEIAMDFGYENKMCYCFGERDAYRVAIDLLQESIKEE